MSKKELKQKQCLGTLFHSQTRMASGRDPVRHSYQVPALRSIHPLKLLFLNLAISCSSVLE